VAGCEISVFIFVFVGIGIGVGVRGVEVDVANKIYIIFKRQIEVDLT
jgi:small-conductance mechanosensitive channel